MLVSLLYYNRSYKTYLAIFNKFPVQYFFTVHTFAVTPHQPSRPVCPWEDKTGKQPVQALEVGSTLTFIARNSGALKLGVWHISWGWWVSMGSVAIGEHVTVDHEFLTAGRRPE